MKSWNKPARRPDLATVDHDTEEKNEVKRKRNAVAVAVLLTSSAFATGSEVADRKALTLEGAGRPSPAP